MKIDFFKKYRAILSVIVLATVATAFFLATGTGGTYQDCILEHIATTQTNSAAAAVSAACRQKYPNEFEHVSFEEFSKR